MSDTNQTRRQVSGAFRSRLWNISVTILLSLGAMTMEISAAAAQQSKPNILAIMGDDIGYWNISAYNRGMMGYAHPTSTASPTKVQSSPTTTASSPALRGGRPSLRGKARCARDS